MPYNTELLYKEITKLKKRQTILARNLKRKLDKLEKAYEEHRIETGRLVSSNHKRNWTYISNWTKKLIDETI